MAPLRDHCFVCSTPLCLFWSRWRSKVDQHREKTKLCALSKTLCVPITIDKDIPPQSHDGRKFGVNTLINTRVPSGIGSDRDEDLRVRAEHVRSLRLPESTVDLVDAVFRHAWGRDAPLEYRTVWHYNHKIHNFNTPGELAKVYAATQEEHTITCAVIDVLRAIVSILDRLRDIPQASRALDEMLPSRGLTVFDKLELSVRYKKDRKKPEYAATLRLAGDLSHTIRARLRKTPFTYR